MRANKLPRGASGRMLLPLAILLLLGLAGCGEEAGQTDALPFYNTPDFTPRWIDHYSGDYEQIHSIASYSFINQNGETVTPQTFEGSIYVASFVFTACPSICPPMMANMAAVQETFKNDPDVRFISHSVTPESDSVSVLREFADLHGAIDGKWHLVTGSREEIYTVARQSYFADKEMGLRKGVNDFLHTDNFILVDPQRRIRGVYSGTTLGDMQRLTEDIHLLKAELAAAEADQTN